MAARERAGPVMVATDAIGKYFTCSTQSLIDLKRIGKLVLVHVPVTEDVYVLATGSLQNGGTRYE